jgi:hypothetical protein
LLQGIGPFVSTPGGPVNKSTKCFFPKSQSLRPQRLRHRHSRLRLAIHVAFNAHFMNFRRNRSIAARARHD